jgi:hypothetical protein
MRLSKSQDDGSMTTMTMRMSKSQDDGSMTTMCMSKLQARCDVFFVKTLQGWATKTQQTRTINVFFVTTSCSQTKILEGCTKAMSEMLFPREYPHVLPKSSFGMDKHCNDGFT